MGAIACRTGTEEEADAATHREDLSASAGSGRPEWKSTRHLIERAVARLIRAGGRRTEADAPHLLEGISVVVYDPQIAQLDADLPPKGSGLRWDEFVAAMASAYDARFED